MAKTGRGLGPPSWGLSPFQKQLIRATFVILFVGYAGISLWRDDFELVRYTQYSSNFRSALLPLHFHGAACWIMSGVMLASAFAVAIFMRSAAQAPTGRKPDQRLPTAILIACVFILLAMEIFGSLTGSYQ